MVGGLSDWHSALAEFPYPPTFFEHSRPSGSPLSYVSSSDRSGVFGKLLGSTAHALTYEMEHSAVRPCRENENILKLVVN